MSIVGKDSLFRNSVRWRWARACGRTLSQLSICFTEDYFYCAGSETLGGWQGIQEICNNQWFKFQPRFRARALQPLTARDFIAAP